MTLHTYFTGWWFHMKRTLCLIRGKHLAAVYVGALSKPGFRGVPVTQCQFCAELVISERDAGPYRRKKVA